MRSPWMDPRSLGTILLLMIATVNAAPHTWDEKALDYPEDGCYYQYQYYEEGEQIRTSEPCLNCTCHNQMLMCYLRVCPFIKPVGKNCVVEKRDDQCCPTIMCPQVPVTLVTSTTTTEAPMIESETSSTSIKLATSDANDETHGCHIDGEYYQDGMQVPRDEERPCELCYCIRNSTVCVMQECTLKVDGCDPIYQDGVCCPVKYMCEDGITIPGGLFDITRLTTSTTPKTPHATTCYQNGTYYDDGASIDSNDPCEHCYCMKGDIVCAVEPCMGSLEGDTESCVSQPPPEGECCPKEYKCEPNALAQLKPEQAEVDEDILEDDTDYESKDEEVPIVERKPENIEKDEIFEDDTDYVEDIDVEMIDTTEKDEVKPEMVPLPAELIDEGKPEKEPLPAEEKPQEVTEEMEKESLPAEVTEEAEKEPLPAEVTNEMEKEPLPAEVTEETDKEPLPADATNEMEKEPLPAVVTEEAEKEPLPVEVTNEMEKEPLPAEVTVEAEKEPLPAVVTEEAEKEPLPAEVTDAPLNEMEKEPLPAEVTTEMEKDPLPAEVTTEMEKEPLPAEVTEEAEKEPLPVEVTDAPEMEQLPTEIPEEIPEKEPLPAETSEVPEKESLPAEVLEELPEKDPLPAEVTEETVTEMLPLPAEITSELPEKEPLPTETTEELPEKEPLPAEVSEGVPEKEPLPAEVTEEVPDKEPLPAEVGEELPEKEPLPAEVTEAAVEEVTTQAPETTSTTETFPEGACLENDKVFLDGEDVPTDNACEFCQCSFGSVICATQECPLAPAGCTALPVPEGECCPDYSCPTEEVEVETEAPVEEELEVVTEAPIKEELEIETEAPVEEENEIVTEAPVEEELEIGTEAPMEEEKEVLTESPVEEEIEIETDAPAEEVLEVVEPEVKPDLEVEIPEEPETEPTTTEMSVEEVSEMVTEQVPDEEIPEKEPLPAEITDEVAEEVTTLAPETTSTTQALPEEKPVEEEVEEMTTIAPVEEEGVQNTVAPEIIGIEIVIPSTCMEEGVEYPHLSDVPKTDPCQTCQCDNGNVICAIQDCAGPPSIYENCVPVPQEGECCPKYECDDPTTSRNEDKESVPEMTTQREPKPLEGDGIVSKFGQTLEEVPDSAENEILDDDEETIEETIVIPSIDENEIFDDDTDYDIDDRCYENDKVYSNNEDIPHSNPCKLCFCNFGTVVCADRECLVPKGYEDCKPLPTTKCCPEQFECKKPEGEVEEVETTTMLVSIVPTEEEMTTLPPDTDACIVEGIAYLNGSSVPVQDKCDAFCECNEGEVSCKKAPCAIPDVTEGMVCKEYIPEGECCPSFECVEENEESDLESGSHTITTFAPEVEIEVEEAEEMTTMAPDVEEPEESEEEVMTTSAPEVIQEMESEEESITTLAPETDIETEVTEASEVEELTEEEMTEAPETEEEITESPEIPSEVEEAEEVTTAASDLEEVDMSEEQEEEETAEVFTTAAPAVEENEADAVTEIPDMSEEESVEEMTESSEIEQVELTTKGPGIVEFEEEDTMEEDVDMETTLAPEVEETEEMVATEAPEEQEVVTEQVPAEVVPEEEEEEEIMTTEAAEVEVAITEAPAEEEDEEEEMTTMAPEQEIVPEESMESEESLESEESMESEEDTIETTMAPEIEEEMKETETTMAPEIPEVATDAPVVATEAPVVATEAPEMEEEEIVETTLTPEELEEKPIETTEAEMVEGTTMSPEVEEPEALVETTAAPVETEAPELETTIAPVEEIEEMEEVAPVEEVEEVTTLAPETTTSTTSTTTTTTTEALPEGACLHENNTVILDGEDVPTDNACEFCQCLFGSVICATQECPPAPAGCTALPVQDGECCPDYSCPTEDEILDDDTDVDEEAVNSILPKDSLTESEPEALPAVVTSDAPTYPPDFSDYDVKATESAVVGTASSDILDNNFSTTEPPLDEYEYEDELTLDSIGPGACLFEGKVYVSAQQIPRTNPCDFCFCFRGDIICLQQSCPPPIPGCREETIPGFCCPRYECPVKGGTQNVTIQAPPKEPSLTSWLFGDQEPEEPGEITQQISGCEVQGHFYEVGAIVESSSGPCLQCRCGFDEKLECEPLACEPQPMMAKMLALRR